MKKVIVAALAAMVMVGLSGCGSDDSESLSSSAPAVGNSTPDLDGGQNEDLISYKKEKLKLELKQLRDLRLIDSYESDAS